ncbi:MAG: hypothetical protein IJG87_03200 [Ruminococcus sp.]|nr:hypothetical protein [Ruminococcus sp.]
MKNVKTAIESLNATRTSVNTKYAVLGESWKDKHYRELGDVVRDCDKAICSILKTLLQGEKYLLQLYKSLKEYEDTDLNSSAPSGAGSGTSGSNHVGALSRTNQTFEQLVLDGKNVSVFDHPFEANAGRICNQGSAYPNGPQETCGCCASATIINKAGGSATEYSMVAYALSNRFCDSRGLTSAQSWANILNGNNVSSSVTSGTSLSDLASRVEQGRGVIIGVEARVYDPSMYHVRGGHAMVLESVIRDSRTGRILEYVVVDSNFGDSQSACRRVPAGRLERAFRRFGSQSVCTNNIIW